MPNLKAVSGTFQIWFPGQIPSSMTTKLNCHGWHEFKYKIHFDNGVKNWPNFVVVTQWQICFMYVNFSVVEFKR